MIIADIACSCVVRDVKTPSSSGGTRRASVSVVEVFEASIIHPTNLQPRLQTNTDTAADAKEADARLGRTVYIGLPISFCSSRSPVIAISRHA